MTVLSIAGLRFIHYDWTESRENNPSVLPEVLRQKYLQYLVAIIWSDAERMSLMSRLFTGLVLVVVMYTAWLPRGRQSAGQASCLLRYNPGSESTEQRETGFLETLAKEFPQVKVISSDQYAGTTPERPSIRATDVLEQVPGSRDRHFCRLRTECHRRAGQLWKTPAGRQSKSDRLRSEPSA